MSLYFCAEVIEGKTSWAGGGIGGRVGIDGSVDVPSYWLSPVHQELYQDLSLQTTGCTMSSHQEGLWWVEYSLSVFQKRLGRRARDSCMAGHHGHETLAWHPSAWSGFLAGLTNPFCHPFSWMAALWFSERVFNQELEHIDMCSRWYDKIRPWSVCWFFPS